MRILDLLKGDKTPLWFLLLTSAISFLSGAAGTFILAPSINAKFEVQKAHAQYILDNLKLLNADTADLFGEIVSLQQKTVPQAGLLDKDIDQTRKILTRLLWRANEYETLFKDLHSQKVVKNYVDSIVELEEGLESMKTSGGSTKIAELSGKFTAESRELVKMLTSKADWSAKFDVT